MKMQLSLLNFFRKSPAKIYVLKCWHDPYGEDVDVKVFLTEEEATTYLNYCVSNTCNCEYNDFELEALPIETLSKAVKDKVYIYEVDEPDLEWDRRLGRVSKGDLATREYSYKHNFKYNVRVLLTEVPDDYEVGKVESTGLGSIRVAHYTSDLAFQCFKTYIEDYYRREASK